MVDDFVQKAYSRAGKKWPALKVDFDRFRTRVKKSGIPPEKMALEDLYLALPLENGDPEALDIFYRLYSDYICRISSRKVHNPDVAEDICQQFILALPRKIARYKGIGSLRGWLGIVIANFSIDCKRKIRHHETMDSVLDNRSFETDDHLDIISCNEYMIQLLTEAVSGLKMKWQLMLACKYIDGLTNREIANSVLKTGEFNIAKWHKKAIGKIERRIISIIKLRGKDEQTTLLHVVEVLKDNPKYIDFSPVFKALERRAKAAKKEASEDDDEDFLLSLSAASRRKIRGEG